MATVTIDRIEEGLAVLVWQGRPFEVPVALLPEGAREGDALVLDWRLDREQSERLRASIAARRARLSKDDDGGDFSL